LVNVTEGRSGNLVNLISFRIVCRDVRLPDGYMI
jgi:hypothetical protein